MITFAKLRDGAWGLRGPGLKAGDTVTATRRDGTTSVHVVDAVVWTGPDGISLATIASSPRNAKGAPRRERGVCAHCGDRCNPRYPTCYECSHGGASFVDSRGNFVLGSDD